MTMKSGWCLTGRHGFYCRYVYCSCECHQSGKIEGEPEGCANTPRALTPLNSIYPRSKADA